MTKALQHELQQEIEQYLQSNEIRHRVVRCHEMGGCGVSINVTKLTVLVSFTLSRSFHFTSGACFHMS